jgi:hypothetical protein
VLVASAQVVLHADAKAEQRTQFQFSGVLGKVVNLFGGRAAREGVKSTIIVKGDRKVTFSDPNSRQIIDLREEKIYDVDMEDKEYEVTTFAELRKQLEEARRQAAEDARRAQEKPAEKDPDAKEIEVDFDVKETGEKKQINGFSTRQVLMTITLREKGKKLEESGGMVLTSDVWLAPRMETMREINDFDIRYAKAVYGEFVAGASAQQMAAALAAYPMLKDALQRMREESGKLEGTPIMTTTTIDAVKSAEEMAAQQSSTSTQQEQPRSGGLAGALGGLARRGQQPQPQAPQQRATFLTTVNEVLSVSGDAAAEFLTIPAGFKEDR